MPSYFKHVTTPYGIYSIDYFSFEFYLLTTDGINKNLNSIIEKHSSSYTEYQHFTSTRFGFPKEIFQFPHLHIEISEARTIGWDPRKSVADHSTIKLVLSFNPNKLGENPLIADLLRWLTHFVGLFAFRIKRCDFTYDIPHEISEVYILSRKSESNFKSTRYYGQREDTGYLRVYDKREEIKKKEKRDIGYAITRLEWEQKNEKEFTFDSFSIPDFSGLDGTAKFLIEVPPERIQHALRLVSSATAAKIRKQCFKPYPFEPYIFQDIHSFYMALYGLQDIKFQTLVNYSSHLFDDDDREELPF